MAETGCLKDGHFQNLEVAGSNDFGQTLNIKGINSTENNPVVLTLQTGETVIETDDKIGRIDFQAPDEDGTAAVKVCASIEAVSEGTFSETSNATKLSFKTAASDDAGEKMSLSSDGQLTLPSGQANFRGGLDTNGDLVGPSLVQSFPGSSVGVGSLTVENILSGVVRVEGAGGAQTSITLPVAQDIISILHLNVGDCIFFSIINTATAVDGIITINQSQDTNFVGSSIISVPNTSGATPSGSALFRLRVDQTAPTPTVTIHRIT